MKPISISSSSFVSAAATVQQTTKPHLPPKPIKYRTSSASAAVASFIDDGQHLHRTGLNTSSLDDQEPLSVRRSKLNQGPLTHPIRHQNNNQHPSPQSHPDQGHWFPPSAPNKNLGVSRDRAATRPPGPRGGGGGGGGRSLRHSESRTERMKLERERFLANLIQSKEEDSNKLTHKTNCVTRHPSLPPSISISSSICHNSKTIPKHPIITNHISSQPKPTSRTSSCATKQAIVTSSSTMEVTSSPSKEKPSVTSSEVTAGGDVIYDEPSVEFERKSLDRLVLSDGYLKLRSDVVEEQEKKSVGVNPQTPTPAPSIVRLNNHRTDKPPLPPAPLPFKSTSSSSSTSASIGLRPSRSSESVDRLEALLDFSDFGGVSSSGRGPLRSSFVDPNGPPSRRSVYIELGEYQTLLKHSRNDDEECLYSLPQPLCYSEDTLKAVKLITEKYDTFKRRQLRDLSFRDGTVTNRKSTDNGGGGREGVEPASLRSGVVVPVEQPSSIKESNNNKSNVGGCSVQGVTAAADVADATIEPHTDAKPRVEESGATGKRACVDGGGGGRENAVAKSKQQTGSLLLRDYCNTLETGVDGAADSGGGLSKLNLMRIELFYRSQEASIFVCRCLADLFVGGTSVGEDSSCPLLVHQHTGVPVWLLNSGEGGVRGRELLLFVAERETGFPLWQDKINYLSNYDDVSPDVHSLRVSGSLRKTVRLHMFCERSAAEFMARFREMTSDPNDDLWKISSKDATTTATTSTDPSRNRSGQTTTKKANKKKKTTSKKKKRGSRLSKASISHPCNFVHISRVDPTDPNFRAAFSGLIPLRPSSSSGGKTPTTVDHPGKALDMGANTSEDPSKAFDNVDPAAANDYFESAADSSSVVCEFRPRLPTR